MPEGNSQPSIRERLKELGKGIFEGARIVRDEAKPYVAGAPEVFRRSMKWLWEPRPKSNLEREDLLNGKMWTSLVAMRVRDDKPYNYVIYVPSVRPGNFEGIVFPPKVLEGTKNYVYGFIIAPVYDEHLAIVFVKSLQKNKGGEGYADAIVVSDDGTKPAQYLTSKGEGDKKTWTLVDPSDYKASDIRRMFYNLRSIKTERATTQAQREQLIIDNARIITTVKHGSSLAKAKP